MAIIPAWLQTTNKALSGVQGALGGYFGLDGTAQNSTQAEASQFPERASPTPLSAPVPMASSGTPLMSTTNFMLMGLAGVLLVVLVKK